jgi:hypothetical protein
MSAPLLPSFIHQVALRQATRLGLTPRDIVAAFDAPPCDASALAPPRGAEMPAAWPVPREGMASECWIMARMAEDVLGLIRAFDATEADGVTLEHTDLVELGWAMDTVRRFAIVALSHAQARHILETHHANLARDAAHQTQFSGFASTASSFVVIAAFAIGLCAVGVATLI